ncbi:hypothetical protein D3C71_1985250 [compost metagenome]
MILMSIVQSENTNPIRRMTGMAATALLLMDSSTYRGPRIVRPVITSSPRLFILDPSSRIIPEPIM